MQTWPALDRYKRTISLKSSGIKIFCYDTGSRGKPVCLLVHGLADEADTWRHLIEPLSRDYRVIAPDLPGFGRSDKPKRAYRIPWLTECLVQFMDALSIDKALFAGSSLGGMICQYLGLEFPERVSRLVLIDGLLLKDPQKLSPGLFLFLTPLAGEYLYSRLQNFPDEAYRTLYPYYADLDKLPVSDREFLYTRVLERVADKGQRFAYFSLLRSLDSWLKKRQTQFRNRLGGCSIPALVLWGAEDHILPAGSAEKLEKIQSSSRLIIIPGAGHLPHQEKPELVLDALNSKML